LQLYFITSDWQYQNLEEPIHYLCKYHNTEEYGDTNSNLSKCASYTSGDIFMPLCGA